MRKFCLLLAACLCCAPFLRAQDMERVRATLDTLTAPGMHGRGYVNYGDQIAGHYIMKRFEALGLEPPRGTYYQYFTLPINTFPDRVALQVGSRLLQPGRDYLVDPASPAAEGRARVLTLDTSFVTTEAGREKFLRTPLGKQVVVVPSPLFYLRLQQYEPLFRHLQQAKALVVLEPSRLTATLSGEQGPQPVFRVLKSQWPKKPSRVRFAVDAELVPSHISQNVIGYLPGTRFPDSLQVFTAHYDHLGRMGRDVYFPGANDNASGTSMLLELAAHYSKPENRPACSMLFIAFGGEEAGLVGSRFYTDHPLYPLSSIKFLINLDLVGTGEEGITVVNGKTLPRPFARLERLNAEGHYLPQVKARGEARNSDHYPFSKQGVPAFFIYTMGGPTAYHDVEDRAATLPLTHYQPLFRLLTDFVQQLCPTESSSPKKPRKK